MARMTITQWVQNQLAVAEKQWELCVDATAGKGNDTLFLCKNSKAGGRVLAFDIQEAALETTRELLEKHGIKVENDAEATEFGSTEIARAGSAKLVLDGHENMDRYLQEETVDVMMFNLGYLPGGDHSLATTPSTTIEAIQKGLTFLKKGGMMSVCIYSGGDSGFEERDAVLEFLAGLDNKAYTVVVSRFFNKPNHPPIPVLIMKH